jgi:energy-coupling factor transporter ATP-binding protein EcfA2
MDLSTGAAPRWAMELHQQLLRGRQVILHGNLSDEFVFQGSEYWTVGRFLDQYFQDQHFSLVGRYDVVDGFDWADPMTMQPIAQQIIEGAVRTAVNAPASAGPVASPANPSSAGGPATPVARSRKVNENGPGLSPFSRPVESVPPARRVNREPPPPPDRALRMIRMLLAQAREPTAIALNFTDRLVSDPQRQSTPELPLVILIRKILEEAALISHGPLAHRRNAMVLLASQLEGIPRWLYHENPLITLVAVTRPSQDERVAFFQAHGRGFFDGHELTNDRSIELCREFSDLTDGLTARDLHALQRTSHLERIPVSQIRKLVDRYRFSAKENPWDQLYHARIKSSQETLRRRVIGQEPALNAIEQMLISARVGLTLTPASRGSKPKGVFFFVGPTGVGKTELAKGLTELIFSDESAYARFDMSEYAMEHSSEKLTGSPPGFVGYGDGGQLTNRVLERPFSLLLFDEVEKAHPRIMDKFLQVLEDGRLTDSRGQTADFSQSLIIFTSNIGSAQLMERLQESRTRGLPDYDEVRASYQKAVRDFFSRPAPEGLGRPELLNRFGDNILVFDILRPEYIQQIARKFLDALVESTRERHGIELQIQRDEIAQGISRRMSGDPRNLEMGGRQVRTLVETLVLRPLTRFLFENDIRSGGRLSARWIPATESVDVGG